MINRQQEMRGNSRGAVRDGDDTDYYGSKPSRRETDERCYGDRLRVQEWKEDGSCNALAHYCIIVDSDNEAEHGKKVKVPDKRRPLILARARGLDFDTPTAITEPCWTVATLCTLGRYSSP